MAAPKVDLKMWTSIVQSYDGSQEGLEPFIDSVRLFEDAVNSEFASASVEQKAAALATIIRFIKTRLTGKARAAVGDNPQSITEIVNNLKDRCGSATSADVYISKLSQTRQIGDISKFTTEVNSKRRMFQKTFH